MNTYPNRISDMSNAIVRCLIGHPESGLIFLKNNIDRKDLKIKDIVPVGHPSFNNEYNDLYTKMFIEIADVLNKHLEVIPDEIKE